MSLIAVVLVHCRRSLVHVSHALRNITVSDIFIYSRCGVFPDYSGPGVRHIFNTTNICSCDYAYVKHIARHGLEGTTLFLKDTYGVKPHQQTAVVVPVKKTVQSKENFSCNLYVREFRSSLVWHNATKLTCFRMKSYKGKNMTTPTSMSLGVRTVDSNPCKTRHFYALSLEPCTSALSPPHLPVRVLACFVCFCVFNLSRSGGDRTLTFFPHMLHIFQFATMAYSL